MVTDAVKSMCKKAGLCFLGALAIGVAIHTSCSRDTAPSKSSAASSAATAETPPAGERPKVYSSTERQFGVHGWHDPRVMTIMRYGAGADRRAEYYVLELVDEGRRLARLHKHTLRNEYWTQVARSLERGRFLVTAGEVPGGGLTENCLVIYDFVRQVSVALRQEDFLPADIRHNVKKMGWIEGMGWFSGPDWFDIERLLYYPNDPDVCRKHGYPFLVVDLRSRSVQLATVPDRLAPEVVPAFKSEVTWRWSMGNGSEPAWNVPALLPTYLLAVVDTQEHDRIETLAPLGLVDGKSGLVKNTVDETVPGWQTCFRLDVPTGDYVRCPVSEWIERSEKPESR